MRATMVLETRASDSKEPSIRSSRRKRSSEVSPNVEEHEARNLVTFEVRTTPSSRLSTRAIDPGTDFVHQSVFYFPVSEAFRDVSVSSDRDVARRGGKGEKNLEKNRRENPGSISKNGGGQGGKTNG
jgi:hypothetical protein